MVIILAEIIVVIVEDKDFTKKYEFGILAFKTLLGATRRYRVERKMTERNVSCRRSVVS